MTIILIEKSHDYYFMTFIFVQLFFLSAIIVNFISFNESLKLKKLKKKNTYNNKVSLLVEVDLCFNIYKFY